jgi:hypothetical protein
MAKYEILAFKQNGAPSLAYTGFYCADSVALSVVARALSNFSTVEVWTESGCIYSGPPRIAGANGANDFKLTG